jgi:phosphatidylinositol-bisphosphatase
MRINCIDCIDRTNLYMSRVGFLFLSLNFEHIGQTLPELSHKSGDVLNILDESHANELVKKFKKTWAKNGD